MPVELLFVRTLTGLAPADPIAEKQTLRVPIGTEVRVIMSRPRNPRFHRLVFGLLHLVYQNLQVNTFGSFDVFLHAVKLATGLFDMGVDVHGNPCPIVRSVSYSAMQEAEFSEWWEKVIDLVLTKFLVGMTRPELELQLMDLLR